MPSSCWLVPLLRLDEGHVDFRRIRTGSSLAGMGAKLEQKSIDRSDLVIMTLTAETPSPAFKMAFNAQNWDVKEQRSCIAATGGSKAFTFRHTKAVDRHSKKEVGLWDGIWIWPAPATTVQLGRQLHSDSSADL